MPSQIKIKTHKTAATKKLQATNEKRRSR